MLKKLLPYLLLLITTTGIFLFSPGFHPEQNISFTDETIEGQVNRIVKIEENVQFLEVEVTSGSLKNQKIVAENADTYSIKPQSYKKGDKIIILKSQIAENEYSFNVLDYARRDQLYLLFFIFLVIVLAVSRLKGLNSFASMFFSFLVLFVLILPNLLAGANPVLTAILGAIFIIPVTFYLSHGFNYKTTFAIFGTILSLILTGILAQIFVTSTHLTGLGTDAAVYLQLNPTLSIDFSGLLLAGILISILGILDDITISQAAIVAELYDLKKDISLRELFFRAMNVGKDHIASIVNTLILVYTGAALPLFLFFIDQARAFNEVLNYEVVAAEVIQMLIGSIGLVLAVPITTFISCLFKDHLPKTAGHHHHH